MSENEPTVFIVDDDKIICSGISQLVETIGLKTKRFTSAQHFWDSYTPDCAGCLVLDVRMPGMSGMMLQDRLAENNFNLPIIFVTGHGDVRTGVEAIKKGAIDFIEKPFDDHMLLDLVQKTLKQNIKDRQKQNQKQAVIDRIESLTTKEKQVMYLVAEDKLNKDIANELGINQKKAKDHQSNVMKKMQVDSVVELVKVLDWADIL